MAFLRLKDYDQLIQQDNLEVVTDDDLAIRREGELDAQAEVESYLCHRYDVAKIYPDLVKFTAGDTYDTGDLVAYPGVGGKIYSAKEDGVTDSPADDPGKWQEGDTRSPLIKRVTIDLALYHLHARVNPRNIPELRMTRRDEAIAWLKMVNAGKITPKLPLLQDPLTPGRSVTWGSNDKFNHTY